MGAKAALIIGLAAVVSVGMVSAAITYTGKAKIAFEQEKWKAEDGPDRYQLHEFRHGTIVGLALLDKQIGRVWLLSELRGQSGKKVGDRFAELGVEELWKNRDEVLDETLVLNRGSEAAKDAAFALMLREQYLKQLTRPRAVQEADVKGLRQIMQLRDAEKSAQPQKHTEPKRILIPVQ
jgi:hypothetical protein